ncbi:MAG: ribonuclease HII [Gammaproteobacteria bacterium]|nr:ribonuclease HII [Gammaproteobacteria bacterium]
MKIVVAGTDEVGRGALAGPVVAAAVILENNINGLDDSKKLSEKKRTNFSNSILENSIYAFGSASNDEIDNINILNASLLAMKRAILNLSVKPDLVLVDGIHKPDLDIKMESIIGGDALIKEISAASIIAKVYRDNLMIEYDKSYPLYGFKNHKGYGTKQHLDLIKINGASSIHRKSFKGVK